MKNGLNQVTIIGNVGQDPETRYFPSGGAVTNVSVATSEKWKDKQTGQPVEKTEWHRLVFMDRGKFELGKYAGEQIRKGDKIHVVGKLRTRDWEKDGIKRYSTEIIVEEWENHTKHPDEAAPHDPGRTTAPAQQAAAPQSQAAPPAAAGSFDDDIPF